MGFATDTGRKRTLGEEKQYNGSENQTFPDSFRASPRRRLPLLVLGLLGLVATLLYGSENPLGAVVAGIDAISRAQEEAVIKDKRLKGGSMKMYRDPLSGVVQVVADNEHDLLFGQGYAHAKDRLFQMEILRRMALGELAELVGEKAVGIDKWHRAMGYKQLGEGDYQLLTEDVKKGLAAYCHGVNAYLTRRSFFFNLPVDLMVLGTRPRPFTPQDILAFMRWHSTSMNKGWQNEFVFAKLYSQLDGEIVESLRGALDYDSHMIGGGMTTTLAEAHEVRPKSLKMAAELRRLKYTAKPMDLSSIVPGLSENGGSNAWVISGNHTASGKPIVANDPHLPFSLPAAWHAIRLTSEALQVDQMGLSCPLIPYIIAGTNGHSSNGVTLGRCDVDDIFLEKVREREDGTRVYMDSDGLEKPLVTRTEHVNVKGKDQPVAFDVSETRRGPLVCGFLGIEMDDMECSLASLALQKPNEIRSWFGTKHPLNALRGFTYAQNYTDFKTATADITTCNLNMVYGDEHGDIGYQMTGRVPNRTDVGDSPREGWTSDHQWNGWVPFEAMPHTLNPARGYVVSANQKPYFDGKEPKEFLGNVWQHGWRGKRIEELIAQSIDAGDKVTPEDSRAWQRDLVSVPGRVFAEMFREGSNGLAEVGRTPEVRSVVGLVKKWDGTMGKDSAAAAVFAAFKEQLLREVLGASINTTGFVDEVLGIGMIQAGKLGNDLEGRQSAFVLRILSGHPAVQPLVDATHKTLPELVEAAFTRVHTALATATGRTDAKSWRWGELHPASYVHPLGKAGFPLDRMFNVEAHEVPGDVDTVSLGAYLHQSEARPGLPMPKTLYQQRGFAASSRWIVHLTGAGSVDTHIIVAPGNSGRQSSQHYDDMKDLLTNDVTEGINHLTRPAYDAEKQLETEVLRV